VTGKKAGGIALRRYELRNDVTAAAATSLLLPANLLSFAAI
jgi:hypothetical protein